MTQTPERVNLIIKKGATFRKSFTWRTLKGQAIDLTGYTARMQIRAYQASPDVLVELTTENARIGIQPSEGQVDLGIEHDVTSELVATHRAVYDLELVDPDGDVTTLVHGQVRIIDEVTREGA